MLRLASLTVMLFCAAAVAEVRMEPYVWKPVTIEANGFINGIVYGGAGGACYINTDMGGAYRLDGDTWTPLTDWVAHDDWSLNQNGVETLAVDPADPKKVYLGLGTYMGPSAVMRSGDGGRTWQRTNVDFGMNGNGSARNSGQRMNVDPNLPTRLLYGTRTKGLYESTDAAVTWKRAAAFPATGDTAKPGKDTGIVWTLFDRASGKPGSATPVAYAGVCTTTPDKLFRTLDAGKTWQPIPGQPGGRLLPTRAVVIPGGALLVTYVTGKDYPGPWGVDGGAVWRCDHPTAAAPTWTDISPKTNAGGFSGISIDPTKPDTVYVTTLCHYAPPGDDIWRSRDGGKTWSPLHIRRHRDDGDIAYIKDANIHWTGDVQVNPLKPDEAMFTTGYGLYRTTNLSANEPTWTFFNKGFEQSAALELVSPRSGTAHLISAIGDRDGYRHEDFAVTPKYGRLGQKNDYGQADNLSMGTCNDIDIAADGRTLVRVGAGSQFSNDGGITWHTIGNEAARNSFAEEGQQRGPRGGSVAIAPDAGSAVWAPSRQSVLVATNPDRKNWSAAATWKPVQGLPDNVSAVVADDAKAGTFYARTRDGFYASTDGGRTFERQTATPPAGGYWMRAAPGHTGHLWMTAGDEGKGGLHQSTDGGKTWARVAPEVLTVAKQVGLGAPAPGKTYPAIYVGGICDGLRGFFRSDDEGHTWTRVNDDAHQYGNVTVINGDSRVWGRLYVGTNGRGIIYGDPK